MKSFLMFAKINAIKFRIFNSRNGDHVHATYIMHLRFGLIYDEVYNYVALLTIHFPRQHKRTFVRVVTTKHKPVLFCILSWLGLPLHQYYKMLKSDIPGLLVGDELRAR